MKSIKPRKQRKELFNAPLHKKRKWISAHLEENLLLKYDKRGIPVVKGDTVRVMRGSFKGHKDKVARVNVGKRYVEIEGLTMTKADGKKIAKPVHASNLLITKLNLTDEWRRKKLERGLSEETKKEIEKEAEAQIREIEEEQKRKAEEREEEGTLEETKESMGKTEKNEKKTTRPEKAVKKKTTSKTKSKREKEPEKPKAEKKTVEKKTVKKIPVKTTKKKEEEK